MTIEELKTGTGKEAKTEGAAKNEEGVEVVETTRAQKGVVVHLPLGHLPPPILGHLPPPILGLLHPPILGHLPPPILGHLHPPFIKSESVQLSKIMQSV